MRKVVFGLLDMTKTGVKGDDDGERHIRLLVCLLLGLLYLNIVNCQMKYFLIIMTSINMPID